MQDKEMYRTWRKSTMSDANGGCVEVSFDQLDASDTVAVRDSKLGDGSAILKFTADEWRYFVDGANKGEFNLPG